MVYLAYIYIYIVAVIVAVYPAYIYIYSGILSGSGIVADILSGILSICFRSGGAHCDLAVPTAI